MIQLSRYMKQECSVFVQLSFLVYKMSSYLGKTLNTRVVCYQNVLAFY